MDKNERQAERVAALTPEEQFQRGLACYKGDGVTRNDAEAAYCKVAKSRFNV